MAVLGHSVEMSVHLTAECREGLVVIVRGSGEEGKDGGRQRGREGLKAKYRTLLCVMLYMPLTMLLDPLVNLFYATPAYFLFLNS